MNKLMVFEGNKVEVFEFDGKVLFNPYHVGECLGLSDSAVRKAIANMSEKQVVKVTNSIVKDTHFRNIHNTGENFLTENGVYKLIFRSNKEEAEKFQDWVADEVLPSVRQNGMYATDTLLDDPDLFLKTVTKLTIERKARLQAEQAQLLLKAVIEEQKPAVENYEKFLNYGKEIDMSTLAKILTLELDGKVIGRNKLIGLLKKLGILTKGNAPTQYCVAQKYFVVKIVEENNMKFDQTFITPRGIDWLLKKLKNTESITTEINTEYEE